MTTTSYATGAEMLVRYDARLLGDLARDDGQRELPGPLATNPNLVAALQDAYGVIISRIVMGNRYTLDQLEPANLAPSGVAFLKRLNCELALLFMKQRRGRVEEKGKDKGLISETENKLKSLQDGAAVLLGITDLNAQAATIDMAQPELIPITNRNSIRFNTRNYYPENYPQNGKARTYLNGGN